MENYEKVKRFRGANYSSEEKAVLFSIMFKYKDIIQNKSMDSATSREKNKAWTSIAKEYNSACPSSVFRSAASLKKCYENEKKHLKKAGEESTNPDIVQSVTNKTVDLDYSTDQDSDFTSKESAYSEIKLEDVNYKSSDPLHELHTCPINPVTRLEIQNHKRLDQKYEELVDRRIEIANMELERLSALRRFEEEERKLKLEELRLKVLKARKELDV